MYLIIGNPGVMDQIRAGQSRPLLISGAARNPLLPDVPTFTEAGLAQKDSPTWFGLFAPAGTPDALVQKLNKEVAAVLDSPDFVKRVLTPVGFQTEPNTPQQFASFLDEERARGKRMVEVAGVKLDNVKAK
jgi:tripartite-type tricarboxylate transporter receptor subunit TctC